VPLGELCDVRDGTHDSPKYVLEGYPLITSKNLKNGFIDFANANLISREDLDAINRRSKVDGGDILMPMIGTIGNPVIADVSRDYAVKNVALIKFYKDSRIDNRFLKHVLAHAEMQSSFEDQASGSTQRFIPLSFIRSLPIPLPPLEVQKEIVGEIEGYQNVINGARVVLDNYRPHIPIHADWPMVALGNICSLGGVITTNVDLSLPYFGADSIESNTGKLMKTETAGTQRVNGPVYEFSGQRLLYSKIRPYLNKLTIVDLRGYCSSDMYPLLPDRSKVHITYLATFMLSDTFIEHIRGYYERANIPKINRSQLFEVEIPLPSLVTQQVIVAEIEAEQALVAANRELIVRFEKKIQATLARVWGEEEPAANDA
jgi:type I restriction enzyme M protein